MDTVCLTRAETGIAIGLVEYRLHHAEELDYEYAEALTVLLAKLRKSRE